MVVFMAFYSFACGLLPALGWFFTLVWRFLAGMQGGSRTQAWVFTIRPHTGVPEIGRLVNTQACSDQSSALPVVAVQSLCSIPVARQLGRRWDNVCKPTDFWYPSMRAVCIRYPAHRDAAQSAINKPKVCPKHIASNP
jgi:hypothetical protein